MPRAVDRVCLHDTSRITTDRDLAEIEAESVAFVVCNALGVDTASYSLAYVAGWSGSDLDVVRSTADRVVGAARRILDDLGLGEPDSDAVATDSA